MTARMEKEREQMCRRKGDFALQREHSHNCVLYVCVLYVRVCECACCASAKPTHPQAVDLHILFGLSVCPNIVHPTSPPATPPSHPPTPPPPVLALIFRLVCRGQRPAAGLGTVNRTKATSLKQTKHQRGFNGCPKMT